MIKTKVVLKRVIYGKKGVLLKDREYKIVTIGSIEPIHVGSNSPVGTLSEISTFLKSKLEFAHVDYYIIDNIEHPNKVKVMRNVKL